MKDETRRFLEELPDTLDDIIEKGWYNDEDGNDKFSPVLLREFVMGLRVDVDLILEGEDNEMYNVQESEAGGRGSEVRGERWDDPCRDSQPVKEGF